MAPLADAVRLVDGQEPYVGASDRIAKRLQLEPLGGDEEDVEPTLDRRHERRAAGVGGLVGAHVCRPKPRPLRTADLVFHEGDERRDHEREPTEREGWYLITDALPAARGEDAERVAPREHRPHEVLLPRPERRVAEVLLQERDRIWSHASRCRARRGEGMAKRVVRRSGRPGRGEGKTGRSARGRRDDG